MEWEGDVPYRAPGRKSKKEKERRRKRKKNASAALKRCGHAESWRASPSGRYEHDGILWIAEKLFPRYISFPDSLIKRNFL